MYCAIWYLSNDWIVAFTCPLFQYLSQRWRVMSQTSEWRDIRRAGTTKVFVCLHLDRFCLPSPAAEPAFSGLGLKHI